MWNEKHEKNKKRIKRRIRKVKDPNTITKEILSELKSLKIPTYKVRFVMITLTTILQSRHYYPSYIDSLKFLANPNTALKLMQSFDPNMIDNVTLKLIERLPAKYSL